MLNIRNDSAKIPPEEAKAHMMKKMYDGIPF